MVKKPSPFILNKVFTRNMINELVHYDNSDLLEDSYLTFFGDSSKTTIEKIMDLYSILKKNYRNEYFYKNTIINNLLVGKYSVNTTSALSELPISESIADIVLINGKAVVYEIKTELDSLQRIEKQIKDYYKAFTHVSIMTDEVHKERIMKMFSDSPIGIYIINNRTNISTIKEPEYYSEFLDCLVIYKILRKPERYKLVQTFYETIPEFNQFEEFEMLFDMFKEINIDELHDVFIAILKERNKVKENKNYFDHVPKEIKSLVYFDDLQNVEYAKLFDKLK